MTTIKVAELPPGWQETLKKGQPGPCLALLPLIEAGPALEALPAVLALLNTTDFALKFRVLLALERLKRPEVFNPLLVYAQREEETHWRLAALKALLVCPKKEKPRFLQVFLADGNSIFLRGAVWAYGAMGREALPYLADFCGQKYAPKVKDDVLAQALYMAAEQNFSFIEDYFAAYPGLRRFWLNRHRPEEDFTPVYDIFPYPDYMWLKAQAAGLSKDDFRCLRFWYRKG